MGVVQAKIQTVEEIYGLIRTAVVSKRPLRAIYHGRDRWFCPHRLGRNHQGDIRFAGEPADCSPLPLSPAN
jgi:hypothetical protein